MNRLNNAISVGDINGKIKSMEHMIEHETLPLNKEKQLIHEIKQLKQNYEELSSNMKKQDQSQQSVDNKDDNIEEHFKGDGHGVRSSEATTRAWVKHDMQYSEGMVGYECENVSIRRYKRATK
ncbi:hypothetical protein JHK85_007439 [Glycine max]|nr:hypothetical protein JHK85_007439 [Glycine max]